MSQATRLLDIATGIALARMERTHCFRFGAVGVRGRDQTLVVSYNELAPQPCWQAHAEARLCKKLTPDSVVAVVRVYVDGSWAMARPCESCQRLLKRSGVGVAYYSIAHNEYGTMRL